MPATITKSTNSTLKAEIVPSLMSVSTAQWRRLFENHPDPPELIRLVSESGMEGFQFHNIIISLDERPVLVLPVMTACYPLITTLDGEAKEIAIKVEKRIPSLLNIKALFVGFVEGEWGQVGVDSSAGKEIIARSWEMAATCLKELSKKQRASATVFWQFTQETIAQIPQSFLANAAIIGGQPFAEMAVPYSSLQEYIDSLDPDMRRYLSRVWKKRELVRIERSNNVSIYQQQIYRLFKAQVARAELAFGEQSAAYFAGICPTVPGAEYVLYFEAQRLAGFELLVRNGDRLISKYFGMHPECGRETKLYFLSWLENVRYCIEKRIPILHAGASGEELKSKLGARLIPTVVVVNHYNPLVNFLLKKFQDDLAYESTVPLSKVIAPQI